MNYLFYFDGGKDNVYTFETDLGISYEVKFRPTNYLLGDKTTVYANHIYEFIIELVFNPLDKNPPLDKLVSKTISEIIKDFYYKKTVQFAYTSAIRRMVVKNYAAESLMIGFTASPILV